LTEHLLQWGLFGVLSVQVYIYYLALSNDPPQRKALVYGVYAVELIQMILYSEMVSKEFAAGFENSAGTSLRFAVLILSSTVAFMVQIFYAYKIKRLAQSNLIAMVVALFSLVQLGGGIAEGVIAHRTSLFPKSLPLKKTLMIVAGVRNGGNAMCDIIIAASMTYYFSRGRRTWKPTQRTVHNLMLLIVGTGILAAVVAIINLILYCVRPSNHPVYIHTTSAILGKLYSNTLMVVSNSRIVFSQDQPGSNELASSISNPKIRRRPGFDIPQGGITVTREQWTDQLEIYNVRVSIAILLSIDIDIPIFVG
ncbi:hypothetical protein BYT27DRAFT_7122237, partial [Phlegmacium glaucopus]